MFWWNVAWPSFILCYPGVDGNVDSNTYNKQYGRRVVVDLNFGFLNFSALFTLEENNQK